MSFQIHIIADIKPTQTGPDPRPTTESWEQYMARLGLPSNAKPLDFPDEAARYDTSVTVAEDYAAHLKERKEMLRERAARARARAEKEKEKEEERERLEAEAEEARVRRYEEEEEEEEEGDADAEGASKGSGGIVANEERDEVSKRRNVFDLISRLATLTNSALDGVVASIFTYYTHRADNTEVQDLNRTMSSLHAKNLELRHQLLQSQIQNGQTISELRAEKMELSQQVGVLQAQLQTQDWTRISELREEMEGLRGELRERGVKIMGLEEKYDRLARERRGKLWGVVRGGLCAGM
ncbi:uncharacterized protein J4E88_005771 [Alternaria novae-zelandiae]|uniref:uncharacterized protein n=1 Tax=Alternaria novae-zelandiae TaxID=430562 RepID=UPI0020C4176E|nr:uncharacterized protein J4E88_005771 [Alternaria novae-zelandiae]KAI4681263.1 hypothetical protein J4E88_005771 [Alternaria novae-zelandiae]